MDETVRADMATSVLCWLATISQSGMPNVSPKEIFAPYGANNMVIADIMSANSVKNIRHNPNVCVSFVDVFRQRGFKISGQAKIIGRDAPEFTVVGHMLLAAAGEEYKIRNLIWIEIGSVSRILAPSYAIFPERSEGDRMEAAYRTYGVCPLEPSI